MKKEVVQQRINEYLSKPNRSLRTLANEIGNISPALLSQIKNGNWEQISDSKWNKLGSFFRINHEWTLIKTKNFNRIQSMCSDAQENARMLAVAGFSGAGKTSSLKKYAADNKNVFYMLSDSLMGKKQFVNRLQQSIGINEGGSVSERLTACIEYLREYDKPLLIIDDAGKLSDPILRIIQIVYDQLEGHAGIAIAGTDALKKYMDRMAAKDKMGFRELKSRIGVWVMMEKPSDKAVREICVLNGINDEYVIKFIHRNATNYRTVREYIVNAKRAASKENKEVSIDIIDSLSVTQNTIEQ